MFGTFSIILRIEIIEIKIIEIIIIEISELFCCMLGVFKHGEDVGKSWLNFLT